MDFHKSMAKQAKQKGLQRLRWYCQMCSKQCPDENGFKQHCLSASHLRNMEEFRNNATGYIDQFSSQFEKSYLSILSHMHHTKRVNANYVYNEMIKDKAHVHMNATMWPTLGAFCEYLGSTGKCVTEQIDNVWFVRWIDPEETKREQARRAKAEAEAARAQRVRAARAQEQAAMARQASDHPASFEADVSAEEAARFASVDEQPIRLSSAAAALNRATPELPDRAGGFFDAPSLRAEEAETEREETNHRTWLTTGCVARTRDGLKGVVMEVDPENARAKEIMLLKAQTSLYDVHQSELEQVVPFHPSSQVLIVDPFHAAKGELATIVDVRLHPDARAAENPACLVVRVRLVDDPSELHSLSGDQVCKYFVE